MSCQELSAEANRREQPLPPRASRPGEAISREKPHPGDERRACLHLPPGDGAGCWAMSGVRWQSGRDRGVGGWAIRWDALRAGTTGLEQACGAGRSQWAGSNSGKGPFHLRGQRERGILSQVQLGGKG